MIEVVGIIVIVGIVALAAWLGLSLAIRLMEDQDTSPEDDDSWPFV